MENSTVNWEQVRIDASINIMNAILSSSIMVFIFQFIFKRQVADIAVEYADKLVDYSNKINLDDIYYKINKLIRIII